MYRFALICALTLTAACLHDDPDTGFGPADRIWVLRDLDGAAFDGRATLTFPEAGRIAGEAPCNRYFGQMAAEYPAFTPDVIGATKMACPDLPGEDAFFAALAVMTTAERDGDTLVLSDGGTRRMVFTAGQ